MTERLRPYLTYLVVLILGALVAVGGLTWAHTNDRTENLPPAVIYCAELDTYRLPMPAYCYDLR